jgi:hypothetical protein
MFNKYRKRNDTKFERILYYIASQTDLRPSEMKQLIYVSTDTKLNQIFLRHPQSDRDFCIQCDSAHGWMVEYLHQAWDGEQDEY